MGVFYASAQHSGSVGMAIKQSIATAAVAPLRLTQLDTDQEILAITATPAASSGATLSSWTTGGAVNGFIRVNINGTDKWVPYYTAPTS